MGVINFNDVVLSADGHVLASIINADISAGDHVGVLGPNGVGKSTFLRTIVGLEEPASGAVTVSGRLQRLDQFVSRSGDGVTVEDLLLRYSPSDLVELRTRLQRSEAVVLSGNASKNEQMTYARLLDSWGAMGGWDLEVFWDAACDRGLQQPFSALADRPAATLSGGEQKRLVLELLFEGDSDVLLLDEPDNFLDVAGKHWLEEKMNASKKTIVTVSHDRALVEATATRILTIEGSEAWMYSGRYSSYDEARAKRYERFDELQRRWEEQRIALHDNMVRLRDFARRSDVMASRYRASTSAYERFLTSKPTAESPPANNISLKLSGSRSGDRVAIAEELRLPGLIEHLDLDIRFGDRVCLIGANGTGKSHFLRLAAGETIDHDGSFRLGSRVVPGYFSQLQDAPKSADEHSLVALVQIEANCDFGGALGRLQRYGLKDHSEALFKDLSGGQQARLSLLLLEAQGANLLLLDEPTDNLDIESSESLERAIADFFGTVIAVSHDRWFINKFDNFLIFEGDGKVRSALEPTHDVAVNAVRRAQHQKQRASAS